MPDGVTTTCGKIPYDTRAEAALALAHIKRRDYRPAISMPEPYHCPFCKLWHLGRKTDVELRRGLFRKGRTKERGRHYVATDEEAEAVR